MARRPVVNSRIRELRKQKGWSAQDLADAVGCSNSAIIKIETGARSLGKLGPDIAKALSVGVEELTGPASSGGASPGQRAAAARIPGVGSATGYVQAPLIAWGRVPMGTAKDPTPEMVVVKHPGGRVAATKLPNDELSALVPENAVVVVDYEQTDPDNHGVYVLMIDGKVTARVRNGKSWQTAPLHGKTETIKDGDREIEVVGRVVGAQLDFSGKRQAA